MTTISQPKSAAASETKLKAIIGISHALQKGRISAAKKIAAQYSITTSDQCNVAIGVHWSITESRKESLLSRIMDNQYLVFGLKRKEKAVSGFIKELSLQVTQAQQQESEEAGLGRELCATLVAGKHAIIRLRRNIAEESGQESHGRL